MSQFNISNLRNVTKFNGSYIQVWKHNLKLVLKSEKLFSVVDGSEILPTTPPATPGGTITHTPANGAGSKDEWYTKDTNALAIITIAWNSAKFHILLHSLHQKMHGTNSVDCLNRKILSPKCILENS